MLWAMMIVFSDFRQRVRDLPDNGAVHRGEEGHARRVVGSAVRNLARQHIKFVAMSGVSSFLREVPYLFDCNVVSGSEVSDDDDLQQCTFDISDTVFADIEVQALLSTRIGFNQFPMHYATGDRWYEFLETENKRVTVIKVRRDDKYRGYAAKWTRKMLLSYLGPDAFARHYAITMDVVARRHIKNHWQGCSLKNMVGDIFEYL
ncbi:hypothetical protein Tco_1059627 [Tanacetum coccineum]